MYLITKNGQVNKVIFPQSISVIQSVIDDPHGNVYTQILLNNGTAVDVCEPLSEIMDKFGTDDSIILTEFDYTVEFSVK